MSATFASRGSQRWLQVAVANATAVLDRAMRTAGAIAKSESIAWASPILDEGFVEYRDSAALRRLEIASLPNRSLQEFWPRRGPVWDGLGISSSGAKILVEAKAHIAEAASPASKASPHSLQHIRQSLSEARRFYAPRAKAEWSGALYQYANRLAFHYLLTKLNGIQAKLVFLDFCNATDVKGPDSEAEWKGATELIHALLGLPSDLREKGVFHVYVDVREIEATL